MSDITKFFQDIDDFEVQLSTAIHNARTTWKKLSQQTYIIDI